MRKGDLLLSPTVWVDRIEQSKPGKSLEEPSPQEKMMPIQASVNRCARQDEQLRMNGQ